MGSAACPVFFIFPRPLSFRDDAISTEILTWKHLALVFRTSYNSSCILPLPLSYSTEFLEQLNSLSKAYLQQLFSFPVNNVQDISQMKCALRCSLAQSHCLVSPDRLCCGMLPAENTMSCAASWGTRSSFYVSVMMAENKSQLWLPGTMGIIFKARQSKGPVDTLIMVLVPLFT